MSNLKWQKNKSCGCEGSRATIGDNRRTHGMSGTKLQFVYGMMLSRCSNPNVKGYSNYGGRGIRVCDEWRNSAAAFFKWALSNGYAEGLQLDRIDNDGNYEPVNCRFVTPSQNSLNRRPKRKAEL